MIYLDISTLAPKCRLTTRNFGEFSHKKTYLGTFYTTINFWGGE